MTPPQWAPRADRSRSAVPTAGPGKRRHATANGGGHGRSRRTARARDNREVCAIQNVRIVLPRADLGERVGTDQKKQFEGGEPAFVKAAQGQRRIRRSVVAELDIGGLPSCAARDRQCDHRKPVIGGGDGLRPVRWHVRRDDEHVRQAERGLGRAAQVDVPAVNRVERATENADAARRQALRA